MLLDDLAGLLQGDAMFLRETFYLIGLFGGKTRMIVCAFVCLFVRHLFLSGPGSTASLAGLYLGPSL